MALRQSISRTLGNQQGMAVYFIVFFIALLIFIPVMARYVRLASDGAHKTLHFDAQADNVARAGLEDGIHWFRAQGAAVTAFNPSKAKDETIEEATGLVREFQLGLDNTLWTRYEIRKDPASVSDITAQRLGAAAMPGLVWYLESAGYVYRRRDPSHAFNQAPNEIVGRSHFSTEIRRLSLRPPPAALTVNNLGDVTLGSNTKITGESPGVAIAYYTNGAVKNTGATVGPAASLASAADWSSVPSIQFSMVFGGSMAEVRALADFVYQAKDLPSEYPANALVYVEGGHATFKAGSPFAGRGILIVDGDMTIGAGAQTVFTGLIYVTGKLTIQTNASITGAVVVAGDDIKLQGGASDFLEMQYDPFPLNAIAKDFTQYREIRTANRKASQS